MWISHRKEIQKLTSYSLRRSACAQNVSFRISLRWLIHIINSVDKIGLAGQHDLPSFKNYFEPCLEGFAYKKFKKSKCNAGAQNLKKCS